jgi:lipopolysaccharide transport system permease protein
MSSLFDRVVERVPVRTGLGLAQTIRLLNPVALARGLWTQRELIFQLTKRDILGRYRGSYLGLAWSFLTPLLMLTIFTLVFGVIFQARWGLENESRFHFALVLFCGLIVFNLFSECVTRSPGLVLSQPQYVKKIRFPLEVLPVIVFLSAAAHAAASLLILLLGLWLGVGIFHWTVIWFPLVMLPLAALCLGLSWWLASMGVYFRDIGQIIGVATMAVLFLSPIFYPVSSIPEWLRPFYELNPLALIIGNARATLIWGQPPNWFHLLAGMTANFVVALLGYAWFQRTRRGFADVL